MTDAQMLKAWRRGAQAIVWDMGALSTDKAAILEAFCSGGLGVSLLIRARISRASMADVFALSKRARLCPKLEWQVSLRGFDDLTADVLRLMDDWRDRGAYQLILPAVGQYVDPSIDDIVYPALIAGRRRIAVNDFARRCGRSARAMETRLRRLSAPSPKHLLRASLELHVAYWLEALALTPKQVAHLAGYRGVNGAEALAEYMHRHFRARWRKLGRAGLFSARLRDLISSFPDAPRKSALQMSNTAAAHPVGF